MNRQEQVDAQRMAVADERVSVRRYLSNRHALDAVLADIAEGVKPTDIAKRLRVSYQALYTVLTGTYKEQYRAARAAFAEVLAEKNLDMADRVERLELPHDAAKTAAGLRHWHMERTASDQWGQRSSVDVTHRGVIGLHLEAIRQLAGETLEGEYGDGEEIPEEAEYTVEGHQDRLDSPGGDAGGVDDDNGDDHMDGEDDSQLIDHPLL